MRTDTHYHVDQARNPLDVLRKAEQAGVRLVTPSLHPASYRALLRLQRQTRAIRWVTAGLHPERPPQQADVREALLQAAAADGIGEVGLPCYNRPPTLRDYAVFRAFCELAAATNKPLIVHAVRQQAAAALALLQQAGVRRAVFHWLKADRETVDAIVRQGYCISVTPEVTFQERDVQLVRAVPADQLLLETDGPYPLRGPYAGREPLPEWVDDAALTVAAEYRMSVREFWVKHEQTLRRLFDPQP
ncbi:MAG: TatD family hydrolase [Alicyclobacillus sp.]|nr:TatD family hydrolase [Alicyclobacillus sp.]